MTDDFVPLEVWAAEGQRSAALLSDIAAAVVAGRDPEATAAVALGIARACAGERRVAVADLIGGVPALTPLDDQPGLLECLRDGTPVSEIGQPLPDAPAVYLLPAGQGPIAERWVLESARWERLVNGFREVDALLLLVVRAGTPGLDALIERVDGVVAVDLPPAALRSWPLIATIDHPEPELPPIARTPTPGAQAAVPAARRGRKVGRWLLAAALLLAAGWGWFAMRGPQAAALGRSDAVEAPMPDASAAPAADGAPAPAPDAVAESDFTLGEVVNPADAAIARRFSVEVVAASSPEGANSTLSPWRDVTPTVAPVVLGSAPAVWYRGMVGAWTTREDAEAWLARQRALGLLRGTVGRVLEVPFALQLFAGSREDAFAMASRLQGSDLAVYVMESDDGRVRVCTGAFETADQALWFAAQLHGRGLSPQLVYRTGRTL